MKIMEIKLKKARIFFVYAAAAVVLRVTKVLEYLFSMIELLLKKKD